METSFSLLHICKMGMKQENHLVQNLVPFRMAGVIFQDAICISIVFSLTSGTSMADLLVPLEHYWYEAEKPCTNVP